MSTGGRSGHSRGMTSIATDHWLGVEPRHLATFAAVADAGSFRGAAVRLGYVQSAVSQQIAHLERAVGTRLIERAQGNRELRFTPAGERLLPHAERIVDQVRAAAADVSFLTAEGPIHVAIEAPAARFLPRLRAVLGADASRVDLAVTEAPAAVQTTLLTRGAIDIGLGCFEHLGPGFRRRVIHVDEWVLALPAASPLAAATSVTSLSGLHGMALVEPSTHPLPVPPAELAATRVIRCDRLAIALDLVRAGTAAAILPAASLCEPDPDVHVMGLGDLLPARPISAIWLAERRFPSALGDLEAADSPEGRILPVAA
jgi:DNA-binding transcriptional LysR family regulator